MDQLFTAGLLHHRAGRWVEASRLYRQILATDPAHAGALLQLGSLALTAGDAGLSLQLFQRAVAVDPDSAAGWNYLGHYHCVMADPATAQIAFERALAIDPNFAPACSNLGRALQDQGLIDQAIATFERALQLAPQSAEICSNLVYATCFSEKMSPCEQLAVARQWADRHRLSPLQLEIDFDPARRLKIGYISPDFRQHVVGRNVLPILQNHNHDQFEVHCFFTSMGADGLTPAFAAAADRFHSCASLEAGQLAELIRSQKIDILVDLSLHMAGNRLLTFTARPAPVQLTWAGYPGTTGLAAIDYRLTDPYLDAPGVGDEWYSEKSIRLPSSFWCYRPMENAPEVNASPAVSNRFVTFGCLNNFAKVNETTLNLWADVLARVSSSRLILLCPPGSARSRVLGIFQQHHITAERISFDNIVSPEQHMARYHLIDIALDPVGYTGHTTTLDALWMGIPVITVPGATCVSRGSVTALTHTGLTDLIASTADQFVQIAAALAHETARLEHLRRSLRDTLARSPICDERRFTTEIESAYRLAWQWRCASR